MLLLCRNLMVLNLLITTAARNELRAHKGGPFVYLFNRLFVYREG